ncbi:hypothetical protein FRC08_000883 [Ceratobasidium sp. 394]|nr:hypothetical protein FRC08_000883 [Ceratobasidium sp. 394]
MVRLPSSPPRSSRSRRSVSHRSPTPPPRRSPRRPLTPRAREPTPRRQVTPRPREQVVPRQPVVPWYVVAGLIIGILLTSPPRIRREAAPVAPLEVAPAPIGPEGFHHLAQNYRDLDMTTTRSSTRSSATEYGRSPPAVVSFRQVRLVAELETFISPIGMELKMS